jgi:hypothetical protein
MQRYEPTKCSYNAGKKNLRKSPKMPSSMHVYRRAPTAFHPDVYIRLSKTVGAGDNDIESIILATYEEQCYSLCDLKPCRICASC